MLSSSQCVAQQGGGENSFLTPRLGFKAESVIMADVEEAPLAPHRLLPPDSMVVEAPRIQMNIDWSAVDLESITLPPGEDMGIKRLGVDVFFPPYNSCFLT